MYTKWTDNLPDKEDKAKFEQQIYSAKDVLDRQKDILEQELKTLDRSEVDIKIYETPNWAERQAHKNGDRSRIMWLLKLVDLNTQDTKHDR